VTRLNSGYLNKIKKAWLGDVFIFGGCLCCKCRGEGL